MFVTHIFATETELPAIPPGLYQYVVAANGVFVRARRPGLEAMIPVATLFERVRGLAEVEPYVHIPQRVYSHMIEHLLLDAWRKRPNEALYYCRLDADLVNGTRNNAWEYYLPAQTQAPGSVHPTNPYASGTDTLMEVHSHHDMSAYFSPTDTRDESGCFRLFAVVGMLNSKHPEIRVRVGIYGHFWEIPARTIFDLPAYAKDALDTEKEIEVVYEDVIE